MNTTPIPWSVDMSDWQSDGADIIDANKQPILTYTGGDAIFFDTSTAALIVRAVNNHQKLIEALQRAEVELCALVADPSKPNFLPALDTSCSSAEADNECLCVALSTIRDALQSAKEEV